MIHIVKVKKIMRDNDIGASFAKLMGSFYFNYRGVILERREGGYFHNLHFYATLKEVDEAIARQYKSLENSLNKIKPK